MKMVLLKISQNSLENTCVGVSFIMLRATLLKKILQPRYFPVNFAKFLKTPLQKTSGKLLVLT